MEVKLTGISRLQPHASKQKAKYLKWNREKLASRQLNSPFCTAYGPPEGFR